MRGEARSAIMDDCALLGNDPCSATCAVTEKQPGLRPHAGFTLSEAEFKSGSHIIWRGVECVFASAESLNRVWSVSRTTG